jgi:hypothetical protein
MSNACANAAKDAQGATSQQDAMNRICSGGCGQALGNFFNTYGCCFRAIGNMMNGITGGAGMLGGRRLLQFTPPTTTTPGGVPSYPGSTTTTTTTTTTTPGGIPGYPGGSASTTGSASIDINNPFAMFEQMCPNIKFPTPQQCARGTNVTITLTLKNLRYSSYNSAAKKTAINTAIIADLAAEAGVSVNDITINSATNVDAASGMKTSAMWSLFASSQQGTQMQVLIQTQSSTEGNIAADTLIASAKDGQLSMSSTSAQSSSTKNDISQGQTADPKTTTVQSVQLSSANATGASFVTFALAAIVALFARIF